MDARDKAKIETAVEAVLPQVWLGITGIDLVSKLAEEMNLPVGQNGVLVQKVFDEGPAKTSGIIGSDKPYLLDGQPILIGGDVITAIDGSKVTSFDQLRELIGQHDPGDNVNILLIRDGKEKTIQVELESLPG